MEGTYEYDGNRSVGDPPLRPITWLECQRMWDIASINVLRTQATVEPEVSDIYLSHVVRVVWSLVGIVGV